jgi:predicted nucleic acid-binding protein
LSEAGYLVDTNVVSEGRRQRPDPQVTHFMQTLRGQPVFISVLTLGELRRGAELRRRSDAVAAEQLAVWIDVTEINFADRVLPVDRAVADIWGKLSADRPRPVVDALIAATALAHDLTLVTRNTRDFADTGVALVNPWK